MKTAITLLLLSMTTALPVFASDLESRITIREQPDMAIIYGNGDTTGDILDKLSEVAGFTISGKLENPGITIDYKLKDKLSATIEHLVKPQSVIVMKRTGDDGIKRISSIELLPTGNEDSTYLPNAPKTVYKTRKSSGDPQKDEFHRKKDLRRAERHAQGLGRINQPNNGIISKEEALEYKAKQRTE